MKIPYEPRVKALVAALGLAFAGDAAAQAAPVCVSVPSRVCTVTSNLDNGPAAGIVPGSLRDALNFVSGACGCTGPYTVRFAFAGLTTIALQQPLLVGSVGCAALINGYDSTATPSLPATPNTIANARNGSDANPLVVLDAAAVSGAALIVQAPNSVVKGLVFQNYGTTAIRVQAANVAIQGNHIGTNAAGTACAGAGNGVGIEAVSGPFTVGGPNPADRNIIGCSSTNNAGIDISAFQGDIAGNLIGTGAGGQALPNDVGILATGFSPFDVNIGFPSTGLGNLIARNAKAGVVVSGANVSGVYVQGNDIFLNGGLGLDLDNSTSIPRVGDGPNASNPSLTPSFGLANSGINAPRIAFVRYDGANTAIDWAYNGFANSQVFLDFHSNPAGLGIDEGARWFGASSGVLTDGAGAAAGSLVFAGIQPSPTATATMINSGFVTNVGTSEFSAPASLEVSPRILDFGSVPVSTSSAPQTVTFTNLGSSAITIGAPLTVGNYSATSTCDGTTLIPSGGTCTAAVTFNPLVAGLSTDFLDMPTSGTGGGRGIQLTGNGVFVPDISATPPGPIDFGSVGLGTPSAPTTITFSNIGTGTLLISSVGVTGAAASSFAVLTDTCTNASLNATTPTCSVTARMTPQAVGALAASIGVVSNDANSPNFAVGLTGTGLAPVLASNPVGPINLGASRVGTSSAPTTITLSNAGAGNLVISGVTLTGAAASSFTVNSTACITTLNATTPTCTMTAVMTPQVTGALAANLVVASNDPATPNLSIGLSGTGLTPVLSANPAGPINFGTVQVGLASAPVSVNFTNSGNGSILMGSATLTGAAATSFQVIANTCSGQTLTATPPTSCTVSLAMQPQATGAQAATLQVASDATNPNLAIALAGTGSAAPVVAPFIGLTPAGPVDFGPRRIGTQSPPTMFTLAPSGPGPVAISSVAPRGTGFSVISDTCTGATIAQGATPASCAFSVIFAPAFEGAYRTSIQVLSNAANPQLLLDVTGTGTPLPVGRLAASPGSVPFGTQAVGVTTNPQTVQVTNTGTLPVTVSNVRATGDFAQANDCRLLDSGQSCRALVTFTPTVLGERTGNLIVESDATNPQLVVSLQGTASPAPVPIVEHNPGAVTFGTSLMGSGGGGTLITLRNSGGASLELGRIYTLGDFRVTHNCPANIAPGASCQVTVSFTPSITGSRTGKLVVESNASGGNKEAPLSGTGCRNFGLGTSRLAAPVCK